MEAYASNLARTLLTKNRGRWTSVNIRAAKPHALAVADSAEIEITRDLSDYTPLSITDVTETGRDSRLARLISAIQLSGKEKAPPHTVAIAFGSNLGDRFANIEFALRLLESPGRFLDAGDDVHQKDAEIAIIDTSFLYETAAMYVTGQPSFVNGACLVRVFICFVKDGGRLPRPCFRWRQICRQLRSFGCSRGLNPTSGDSHRSEMDPEPSTWILCCTVTTSSTPGRQVHGLTLETLKINWSSLIRGSRRGSSW